MEAAEYAALERVGGFNHRRPLGPTGITPPADARSSYPAALKQTTIAARPQPGTLRGCRPGSPGLKRPQDGCLNNILNLG